MCMLVIMISVVQFFKINYHALHAIICLYFYNLYFRYMMYLEQEGMHLSLALLF